MTERVWKDDFRDRRKMFAQRQQCPSFSSTLLEKIYCSIDDGCGRTTKPRESPFYGETGFGKKKAYMTLHEACLLERNLMGKRASRKTNPQLRQLFDRVEMSTGNQRGVDHNGLFFSTSSCSSETSSGGFSSSESEPVVCVKTRASCFAPLRLKPVRTKASEKPEKPEKPKKPDTALFREQSSPKQSNEGGSNGVPRSKALKIFEQLKKTTQPISPGGRLINFITSLFSYSASSNDDRSKGGEANGERKTNSSNASTCSYASSPLRSRPSKHPQSMSERFRNGARKTVRFCPVDVIIDEDCRPCGHKRLFKEGGDSGEGDDPGSVPVTQSRRSDQQRHASWQPLENKHRERVKEPEQGLLTKGHRRGCRGGIDEVSQVDQDNDDEDDDVISCSSSDLFELPVFETTRVGPDRPIY